MFFILCLTILPVISKERIGVRGIWRKYLNFYFYTKFEWCLIKDGARYIYMVFRYFGFIFEIVGRKIGIPRIIALLKLFAFPSGVKWRALTSKRGGRKTFFFHSPSHANFYLLWDSSRVKLVMKSMNFRIFLQIRVYFIIIIFLKSL